MIGPFTLSLYNDLILSIKLGRGVDGFSNAKPIFLLTILEGIALRQFECNKIIWNDKFLQKTYDAYMRYYNEQNKTPLVLPYYHLNTAPFYHLVWKEEIRPPIKGHTPSAKYLQEHLLYAKLDDELWELLQNVEYREYIRKSIITRFLYKN